MVIAPDSTPLSFEQALALLGESRRQWDAEKRLLELRIQSLEHRLFGTKSEKVALEDKQVALIDEVFTHPGNGCHRRCRCSSRHFVWTAIAELITSSIKLATL